MWNYRAQITSVHDGDTFTAVLDLGFRLRLELDVRLLGVYAPELSQTGGTDTKQFVINWVNRITQAENNPDWPFVVTTVRLKNDTKEVKTFDRYVCTVTDLSGSETINVEVEAYVVSMGYPGGTGS